MFARCWRFGNAPARSTVRLRPRRPANRRRVQARVSPTGRQSRASESDRSEATHAARRAAGLVSRCGLLQRERGKRAGSSSRPCMPAEWTPCARNSPSWASRRRTCGMRWSGRGDATDPAANRTGHQRARLRAAVRRPFAGLARGGVASQAHHTVGERPDGNGAHPGTRLPQVPA